MEDYCLQVIAGPAARKKLALEGFRADVFGTLVGASGGPKGLALTQMDRVLADQLIAPRTRPLNLVGSSVGAWRHIALAQAQPQAAIDQFETAYINQRYEAKPTVHDVSAVALDMLEQYFPSHQHQALIGSPYCRTHIVTARKVGLFAKGKGRAGALAGFITGGAANAFSRRFLQSHYQRVVFSSADKELGWQKFSTEQVRLTEENIIDAVMASGSIPGVLEGVENPAGATSGVYWDGGVIDYHFSDELQPSSEDLVIYPHFYPHMIPGWLDKALKSRRLNPASLDNWVLICPHPDFVAKLPFAKIPDRTDFKLDNSERLAYWWQVVAECGVLAERLQQAFMQGDFEVKGIETCY